jgi:hypothetical protein
VNLNKDSTQRNNNAPKREETPAFKKQFSSDVKKVFTGMKPNPFELDTLTEVNNNNIAYLDEVYNAVKSVLVEGQEQSDVLEKKINSRGSTHQ